MLFVILSTFVLTHMPTLAAFFQEAEGQVGWDPISLWRQMGWRSFMSFQFVVAGTFVGFLLNPVYWTLTTLWLVRLGVQRHAWLALDPDRTDLADRTSSGVRPRPSPSRRDRSRER